MADDREAERAAESGRRSTSRRDTAPDTAAAQRTDIIKARALGLGFEQVRIASLGPLEAQGHYEAWLAAGHHGGMAWLASAEHRERRADPTRLLRPLRAVVCVMMCHTPERDDARDQRIGRIARYAAGDDYHLVMRERLRVLEQEIRALAPGSHALWYADTGAILERGWAERAGLGWIGKHSGLLSPTLGSYFLLGEVLVDFDLVADPALEREHCGTCERCLAACPTRAIVAPYRVDARRCISYLTIEHRGAIPRELRPLIGDWVFGCDLCQEACPWNRFAPPAREARLHARTLDGWTLERFLSLDEPAFLALFAASPIRRTGRAGFLRNVCIALGNRRDADAAGALMRTLAEDPAALVRAHAAWALGEIGAALTAGAATTSATATLRDAIAGALANTAATDADSETRDEACAAHGQLLPPVRGLTAHPSGP